MIDQFPWIDRLVDRFIIVYDRKVVICDLVVTWKTYTFPSRSPNIFQSVIWSYRQDHGLKFLFEKDYHGCMNSGGDMDR